MAGAQIGEGSQLGANVFVEGKVRIGRNVKVKNNVSLYDGVMLEDDVFVGPSAVFTNVLTPRSRWPRKHEFRDTIVQKGATIGANAVVVCGVTIGVSALIGAGSVVTRDVAPFSVVTGNPARQKNFVCQCGVLLPEARSLKAGLNCNAWHVVRPIGAVRTSLWRSISPIHRPEFATPFHSTSVSRPSQ